MAEHFARQYPELCSRLKIGSRIMRNRMCSAPMGFPDLTEDGCMTEGAIAFYENRARGGAAVVTVSEACVDYKNGKSHGRLINLQNPAVLASLTNCARAIKRHGALASIELNHSGMLSEFDVLDGEKHGAEIVHYGPSAMTLPDGTQVREMTTEMIDYAVSCFARGAAVVKRAGFDMLMLHAGHGWLIHQFLSPVTNRRNDEYGGSLENRARFALRVIDAVRQTVGEGFPIELRMSAMETAEGGVTLDRAIEFAKLIDGRVDIIHVSAGGEPDFGITHPSMFSAPGCNVGYACEIKKHVKTPVACVGALGDAGQMEEIIKSGKADIICMARSLLADPELPKKIEQNRADEILPCQRCFVCHAERMLTQTRICAVNPEIGREYEAKFAPRVTQSRSVLVAGGGPGGMQFALTAAQRGHAVTLAEASGELGGALKCEAGMPFKAQHGEYIRAMRRRLELAGVNIMLNTRVTPELVRGCEPDVLALAIGARPRVPKLPGADGKSVIPVTELCTRISESGERVAVIGGGLSGCEAAVYLAGIGKEVTVISRSKPAADANPRHRPLLMAELSRLGVSVIENASAESIDPSGIVCRRKDGEKLRVACETAVLAVGSEPRTEETEALRDLAPEVCVIGDCDRPGSVRDAVFRAYHAALDI